MNTRHDITKKRPSTTQAGAIEKAGHHAHVAHGHHLHAIYHAEEAAKHHAEDHGSK